MPILMYTGPYFEMLNTLAPLRIRLAPSLSSDETQAEYLRLVTRDLIGLRFFIPTDEHTIGSMQQQLLCCDHLFQSPSGSLGKVHYAQGDFDGSVFSQCLLRQTELYSTCPKQVQSLDFVFLNSTGVPCGLSIAYSEGLVSNSRAFILTIIKNVTQFPQNRSVTCFVHSDFNQLEPIRKVELSTDYPPLVPHSIQQGEYIRQLNQTIDCEAVSLFLAPLFTEETIHIPAFRACNDAIERYNLSALLQKSIFDRLILAVRKNQTKHLSYFMTLLYQLEEDHLLKTLTRSQIDKIYNNQLIPSLENRSYDAEKIQKVIENTRHYIKNWGLETAHTQTFFRRHLSLAPAIILSLAAIIIPIVLFGLGFIAGIPITLITASAVLLLTIAWIGKVIVPSERSLRDYVSNKSSAESASQNQLQGLEDSYKREVLRYLTSTDHHPAAVMSC